MAGNARTAGESVLSKAFSVLDAFDAEHPQLSLTEIAARSGLPLTTTHRLVAELQSWRAMTRGSDGRYRIGVRLWEIGLLSSLTLQLRDAAMPFMEELCAHTGENVQLAVRDGFDALYVERMQGPDSVPILSRSGGRLPLHPTGVGKVLLAAAGAEAIAEYVARPLERVTKFTIVQPRRLLRELADVHARGFATTGEEMTLGTYSIAVPIVLRADTVAALGLVLRSHRDLERKHLPRLQRSALGIARRLDGS